jgi:hypothetical protein
MKRKLLILDLVLVGIVVGAGVEFRKSFVSAKRQEQAAHINKVKPVNLPPLAALKAPKPVMPADYIDVAQKMLFDASRNPNVEVPPPPAPPPPPPPPPMPPLPRYHGMMNLGQGAFVILSLGSNGPHQDVHPGEPIGQFTLVSVSNDGLTFDWNGQKVTKTTDELTDHSQAPAAQAQSAAVERTAAPPPAAAQPAQPALVGPGQETAFGWKTCNMGDGLDAGTVKDGYRKTINSTPFGKTCTWDPVK